MASVKTANAPNHRKQHVGRFIRQLQKESKMESCAHLIMEARMLKNLPRSGYQFLGNGRESVAEHVFTTAFIAMVLARMVPGIDARRLLEMCMLHDLAEARTGDLNYVQKQYVQADEDRAARDALGEIPFKSEWHALLKEFNQSRTEEARLARDADQLSFILELKVMADRGYRPARKWLPHVLERLTTEIGRRLAETILATDSDDWWMRPFTEVAQKQVDGSDDKPLGRAK